MVKLLSILLLSAPTTYATPAKDLLTVCYEKLPNMIRKDNMQFLPEYNCFVATPKLTEMEDVLSSLFSKNQCFAVLLFPQIALINVDHNNFYRAQYSYLVSVKASEHKNQIVTHCPDAHKWKYDRTGSLEDKIFTQMIVIFHEFKQVLEENTMPKLLKSMLASGSPEHALTTNMLDHNFTPLADKNIWYHASFKCFLIHVTIKFDSSDSDNLFENIEKVTKHYAQQAKNQNLEHLSIAVVLYIHQKANITIAPACILLEIAETSFTSRLCVIMNAHETAYKIKTFWESFKKERSIKIAEYQRIIHKTNESFKTIYAAPIAKIKETFIKKTSTAAVTIPVTATEQSQNAALTSPDFDTPTTREQNNQVVKQPTTTTCCALM